LTREAEEERLREAEAARDGIEAAETEEPANSENAPYDADDDSAAEATVAESPGSKTLEREAKKKDKKSKKGKRKGKNKRTVVGYQVKAEEAAASSEEPSKASPAAPEADTKKPAAKKTTSSAVIRAITSTGEHRKVHNKWMTTPPEAEEAPDLSFDALPISKQQRRARNIVVRLGGLGLVLVVGYLLLNRLTDFNGPPEHVMDSLDTPVASTEVAESAEADAVEADAAVAEPSATADAAAAVAEPSATADAAAAVAEQGGATDAAAAETETASAPVSPAAYEETLAEAERNDQRRARRAIPLYEEVLAANANEPRALAGLAFCMLQTGQNARAVELAERAVVLDPTSSKAWITLGAGRQALRDREGAQQAYQACVSQGQGSFVRDCRSMAR